jgi:uncharacterized membrane protein
MDFHGEPLDHLDFAYLALTIGMCFQASPVIAGSIGSASGRRAVDSDG